MDVSGCKGQVYTLHKEDEQVSKKVKMMRLSELLEGKKNGDLPEGGGSRYEQSPTEYRERQAGLSSTV